MAAGRLASPTHRAKSRARTGPELVGAQIQIAPNTFDGRVGTFTTALRTAPRTLPFQSNIDALALEIKFRFRDVLGLYNPQPSEQLCIAPREKSTTLVHFLSLAHQNSEAPTELR